MRPKFIIALAVGGFLAGMATAGMWAATHPEQPATVHGAAQPQEMITCNSDGTAIVTGTRALDTSICDRVVTAKAIPFGSRALSDITQGRDLIHFEEMPVKETPAGP